MNTRSILFQGRNQLLRKPSQLDSSVPPVAGYVKWHTAGVGMFTDTARTSPTTTDGALIAAWADRSTNGDHAYQPTSGARPTYYAASVNTYGYPCLEFDSSEGMKGTIANFPSNNWSIYVVYAPRIKPGGAARVLNAANPNNWLIGPYSGCHRIYSNGWIEGSPLVTAIPNEITVMSHLHEYGVSSEGFYNGTSLGTGSPVLAIGLLGIGIEGFFAEFAHSYVLEIVAYPTKHNATDRGLVHTWLKARWGIGTVPIWSIMPVNPLGISGTATYDSVPRGEEFVSNADIVISGVGLWCFGSLTDNGNATWAIWRTSDGAVMTSKAFSSSGGYTKILGEYIYQAHSYTLPAGRYRIGAYGHDRANLGNGLRNGSTLNGKIAWEAYPSYSNASGTSMPATNAGGLPFLNSGLATFLGI